MKHLELYINGKYNRNLNIGSWGCAILLNGKVLYDFCGYKKGISAEDMETYAVYTALEETSCFKPKDTKISIYTESSKIYSNGILRREKDAVWEKILSMCGGREVKWYKTDRLDGDPVRLLADKLATEGFYDYINLEI